MSIFRLMLFSLLSFQAVSEEQSPIMTKECDSFDVYLADQRSPTKLLERNSKERLDELTLKFNTIAASNDKREAQKINIAFPVNNGWLFSVDYNIQGALSFQSNSGELYDIIYEPVEDIYEFPYGFIVITGRNPEGYHSYGSIYLVTIKNKTYVREKLHELIAAPETSWLTSNGELLINHGRFPSTVFNTTGNLYRVNCQNFPSD